MEQNYNNLPTAILTTIRSDSHSWNLIYVEMFLKENGFNVINLGVCTPHSLVLNKCIELNPSILVVSTINGHGYLEGYKLIKAIRRISVLKDLHVIIGGKLYPFPDHSNKAKHYQGKLIEGGYNKVFTRYDISYEEFKEYIADFLASSSVNYKKIAQ